MKTTQPRKQRKRLRYDSIQKRYGRLSSPLSSELKESHGTGLIPVRTGDTVRVMRGDHKGFEGKVTKVSRKNYSLFVEGITQEKVDGTPVPAPIHPSKVMITRLNLDDKWRRESLNRRGASKVDTEKPTKSTKKRKKGKLKTS